jgi:hypothetical protein
MRDCGGHKLSAIINIALNGLRMAVIRMYSKLLTLVVLLWTGAATAAPDRVSDFALLDNQGNFHQLSRYLHKRALVLMSIAGNCDEIESQVRQFASLSGNWQNQDIAFAYIDSQNFGQDRIGDLNLPVLDDSSQLVSETLKIARAGEVLVLNPERASLFYQGPLGQELDQTLSLVSDGVVENTIRVNSEGCPIEYSVKQRHEQQVPDYASEVAPIIMANCAECHRQDGVGPFAIDSHLMLMGWSPMIREVIINKRMPPTQVDPDIGHSSNARYISEQEMQTLVHWIDAGAPRGEGIDDPLENLSFSDRKQWLLGEPDYIVTTRANDVPPTGVLDYIYVNVDLPFEEDKWVTAVQYLAGDESVLHHLMTYVTAPDESFWGPETEGVSVTRKFLEGYAPGNITAVQFPENTSVHIPAGHKLSMQFHYVTNGKATVDETQLGLYLQDEPTTYEKLTQAVSAEFVIPPNANNYELLLEHVFDENVIVTGFRAHMHFRGKNMKFSVNNTDGSLKDLLSIPAYNYGWQPHYILTEPEFISAGTRVLISGAFDNSSSNPSNPDPEKQVPYGHESWDEMFTGYITFHEVVE